MSRFVKNYPSFIYFCYFLSTGAVALSILNNGVSLTNLIQIFSILSLILIIFAKIISVYIKKFINPKLYVFFLFPAILFIYLLIFATGGISSPFIIIMHFAALALAIFWAPGLSSFFMASNIILLAVSSYFDDSAKAYIAQNPFAAILYGLSFIAIIPLSRMLAREYKGKDYWINFLEKQIATSRSQQEKLLRSLDEIVFVLDKNLNLLYQNDKAKEFSKYNNQQISKDFFKSFTFKDEKGRDLTAYSLPFIQTAKSQTPSLVENIQIAAASKQFIKADMKILPIASGSESDGLIVILENLGEKEQSKQKPESPASLGLSSFLRILNDQSINLLSLKKERLPAEKIKALVDKNVQLMRLAEDFIYSLKLESGEVGALSSLVDIGKVTGKIVEEQLGLIKELGLTLNIKSDLIKNNPVWPRNQISLATEKRVFPEIYVLGNEDWLKNSLRRILNLIILLTKTGGKVELEVTKSQGIVNISLSSQPSHLKKEDASNLFEKFHGEIHGLAQLANTSGLDGYIAKNIIERMGGKVEINQGLNPSTLTLNITFGYQENLQNAPASS